MGLFGDNWAKQQAIQAQQDEELRKQRIAAGTQAIDATFGQFNDQFYNRRAKDYFNVAMPELEQQHARTRAGLGFLLADRGLLNSSIRNQRESSLENETAKQRRILGDTGLSQANDLRANVEDARSRIYGQLLSSADPAVAQQAATRAAGDLTKPSAVGSLGNLFSDWSSIYMANQVAQNNGSGTQPLFSWGNPGGGSSRIVR